MLHAILKDFFSAACADGACATVPNAKTSSAARSQVAARGRAN
jgi:hypothetical protein